MSVFTWSKRGETLQRHRTEVANFLLLEFLLVHLWLFLWFSSINTCFLSLCLHPFKSYRPGGNHVYRPSADFACTPRPVCMSVCVRDRGLRNIGNSANTYRKVSGTFKDAFISRHEVLNTEWCCGGHSLLDPTLHAGVPVLWLTAWRYVWRIQKPNTLLSLFPSPFSPSCPLLSLNVPSLPSFLSSGFSLSLCHFQIVSLHFSRPSLLVIPSCLLSSIFLSLLLHSTKLTSFLTLGGFCVCVCVSGLKHVYFWPTVKHTNYTSSHITWWFAGFNWISFLNDSFLENGWHYEHMLSTCVALFFFIKPAIFNVTEAIVSSRLPSFCGPWFKKGRTPGEMWCFKWELLWVYYWYLICPRVQQLFRVWCPAVMHWPQGRQEASVPPSSTSMITGRWNTRYRLIHWRWKIYAEL